jgi:quaternary ammonium compound-resistance protein SugE
MAWLFLLIAAGFEVTFAMGMKYAEGFTRLWPSVITVVAAVGGVYFLTLAMRELPVSVAYPIWTAIGSLGTVFLGFALLGESLTLVKLLSVGLIVAGGGGPEVGWSWRCHHRGGCLAGVLHVWHPLSDHKDVCPCHKVRRHVIHWCWCRACSGLSGCCCTRTGTGLSRRCAAVVQR